MDQIWLDDWLGQLAQRLGLDIERPACPGFIDGDFDAPQPCPIHPRERDLIVGTHGRSIWILDDISPLEQMTDQTMTQDAALFDVRAGTAWISEP